MAFEHTMLPFEHVEATEHHGHYITTAFGTTVCDFYFMLDRSSPFVKRGDPLYGEQTDAAENARDIVRAVNAHNDLVNAALCALNYIANTESELGLTLNSGDMLRAALSKATGSTEEVEQ